MNQPPSQQGPWSTPPPGGWPQGGTPAGPPPPGWPAYQYPPNAGGAQWYPQPPWAAPTRPKRSNAWWVLGGLAAVIGLVFAAVVIVAVVKHQAPELAVGQCVSSEDYAALNLRPTDCANIDAVYQYAGEAEQGKCPDGERVEDGVYFYLEKTNKDQLCFALNLRQSECYLMDLSEKTMTHEACAEAPSHASSTTGALKVRERIDGEMDESLCPTDTTPLAYSDPARLYCLEKASGGPLSSF